MPTLQLLHEVYIAVLLKQP